MTREQLVLVCYYSMRTGKRFGLALSKGNRNIFKLEVSTGSLASEGPSPNSQSLIFLSAASGHWNMC